MQQPTEHAHWRDSARNVKFFIWDGKAAFPFVLLLVHMRWWTFFLAFGAMIFFTILNRFGFSVVVFGRFLRSFFAGKRKIAIPWWMEKS